jgi:hypothetical protein
LTPVDAALAANTAGRYARLDFGREPMAREGTMADRDSKNGMIAAVPDKTM